MEKKCNLSTYMQEEEASSLFSAKKEAQNPLFLGHSMKSVLGSHSNHMECEWFSIRGRYTPVFLDFTT